MDSIELRVPEVLKTDQYLSAVIEVAEGMLQEFTDNIKRPEDYIFSYTKEELYPLARSYNLEAPFERIPLSRARQLLFEYPNLIRGKGSANSISRATQIYLGVVDCEVVWQSTTGTFDLNMQYGELASTSYFLIDNIYELLRFLIPAGRGMGTLNVTTKTKKTYITQDISFRAETRPISLIGSRINAINETVGTISQNYMGYHPDFVRSDLTDIKI